MSKHKGGAIARARAFVDPRLRAGVTRRTGPLMFKSVSSSYGAVPSLHVAYPPTSWLQHLCPELQVALTAMMTVEPLKVAELGEESAGLVCVLDRAPSPPALAAARRATSSYKLVHGASGIACPVHSDRLFWEVVAEEAPGLAARVLSMVRVKH